MEDREAGADLLGETEQVQLGAEFAVIAFGGLFHTGLVGAQLVLGWPGCPVDTLQLLVLLRTAPICGCDPSERVAVADHPRVGQVRAAAEVLPHSLACPGVHVVVDRQLSGADFHALFGVERCGVALERAAFESDEFELVRLAGEFSSGLVVGHDASHEALAGADDPRHLLVEHLEVIRSERFRDVEVVVEPVGDVWTDAELRFGVDRLHGLREHMRGGVAQNVEPVRRVDRDGLDGVGGRDLRGEVLQLAVDAHCDNGTIGEELEAVSHLVPLLESSIGFFNCSSGRSSARTSRRGRVNRGLSPTTEDRWADARGRDP